MSKIAHILGFFTTDLAFPQGLGFGLAPFNATARDLLTRIKPIVAARPLMESDRTYCHPIPYLPLRRGRQELFTYERPTKAGEIRLHGKTSIGFGGHIEVPDLELNTHGEIDFMATLRKVAVREFHEETGLHITEDLIDANPDLLDFTYIIQSQKGDVDPFHLGIVGILNADHFTDELWLQKDEIKNGRFVDVFELLAQHNDPESPVDLENWSLLIVEKMVQDLA